MPRSLLYGLAEWCEKDRLQETTTKVIFNTQPILTLSITIAVLIWQLTIVVCLKIVAKFVHHQLHLWSSA